MSEQSGWYETVCKIEGYTGTPWQFIWNVTIVDCPELSLELVGIRCNIVYLQKTKGSNLFILMPINIVWWWGKLRRIDFLYPRNVLVIPRRHPRLVVITLPIPLPLHLPHNSCCEWIYMATHTRSPATAPQTWCSGYIPLFKHACIQVLANIYQLNTVLSWPAPFTKLLLHFVKTRRQYPPYIEHTTSGTSYRYDIQDTTHTCWYIACFK